MMYIPGTYTCELVYIYDLIHGLSSGEQLLLILLRTAVIILRAMRFTIITVP